MNKKITFIGAGNMAEALISGFVRSGLVPKKLITASDLRKERLDYFKKKYGVKTEKNNIKAVSNSNIIFLSVKPKHIKEVLEEIGCGIRKNQLIISIAAGVTSNFIQKLLPAKTPVIRTMPNTPALVGEGAIGISKGTYAKKEHLRLAEKLFSTVGSAVVLDEKYINKITAVSGSGPAYVFYLAEAMENAAKSLGLPKNVLQELSRQTIYGAGKLLKDSKAHPSELRLMVTSPGGTTEAAVEHFKKQKFFDIVNGAVKAAKKRADELSK